MTRTLSLCAGLGLLLALAGCEQLARQPVVPDESMDVPMPPPREASQTFSFQVSTMPFRLSGTELR